MVVDTSSGLTNGLQTLGIKSRLTAWRADFVAPT